jgi:hypothetical protein
MSDGSGAMEDAEDDGSDMWASTSAMARLIAGWACVAVAVLNLSMGIDVGAGTKDGPYLLFHVVLLIGGVLLLSLGRLRKPPGPVGYAVAGGAAVLGLVLTALPSTTIVCCMRNLDIRHGFPLTLLAHDPGRRWHFAPGHAAADLLFWGLIGLLLLVGIALVRPARSAAPEIRAHAPTHAPTHASTHASTHAEGRSAAAGAVRDENVGGLP